MPTYRDENGAPLWRGRPEERDIRWTAAVPYSNAAIVLYEYYRSDHPYGGFENLIRINPDGSIVWRAELPEGDDKYVHASMADGRLLAHSYDGYEVEIDLEDGKIISKVFSK
jgi:hypothetical protein